MAIKVTLGEAKPQEEKPFPKLMIRSNGKSTGIILADRKNKDGTFSGTCIYTTYTSDRVGEYCNNWSTLYADYNEPVTIQNS